MQQTLSSKLSRIAIAAACAAMLAACGGGGGSDSNPGGNNGSNNGGSNTGGGSTNTSSSLSLEDQKKGLTATPNSYTLALAVGDTWLLTLDPASLSYTLEVLQTAGIDNLQAGKKYSGSYTDSNGALKATNGDWALKINQETRTIVGEIRQFAGTPLTLAGQPIAPQVSGSGYQAPDDLSRFKGIYFVSGAMRNASNGNFRSGYAGQMRIADDGKSATLCANGLFNDAGQCASVDIGEKAEQATFDLVTDAKTGLISVSNKIGPQGSFSFQLSPLGGYTLVHDRLGKNEEGVLRTGTMYGSQIPELKAGDIDGSFNCKNAYNSKSAGTLTLAGSSSTIASPGYNATESLSFNQIRGNSGKAIKVAGIAESAPQGKPNEGAVIHPISKDQLLVEDDQQQGIEGYAFNICTRI